MNPEQYEPKVTCRGCKKKIHFYDVYQTRKGPMCGDCEPHFSDPAADREEAAHDLAEARGGECEYE